MTFKGLPLCRGCIFQDLDGICSFSARAGVSKAKMGIKTGPSGGCSAFRSRRNGKIGKSPTDNDDRVQELYDQGRNDKEIAQALGYSRNQIYSWRQRHRLPSNGKPGFQKKISS